jgi:predicted ABC-type ATPase
MSDAAPRLRMFAGPNGSGKTTVKTQLNKSPEWFGVYLNPDDLEKAIRETGFLSLGPFQVTATADEVRGYFAASEFLRSQHLDADAGRIEVRDDGVDFSRLQFTSYHASVLADFLRRKALDAARSFSFETVMSSPDKVELLREARGRGFRTYLYFIATEDPAINVQRVKIRVASGGHDVPEDKVVARYRRSLDLLSAAIPHTDRAFFFDTSQEQAWYFAEATDGSRLELKSEEMPRWFEPIWEQFGAKTPSPP